MWVSGGKIPGDFFYIFLILFFYFLNFLEQIAPIV